MYQSSYYREQAERARRLAKVPTDRETQDMLRQMAQDYADIAEDLENGAVEVRHAELMPQNRRAERPSGRNNLINNANRRSET